MEQMLKQILEGQTQIISRLDNLEQDIKEIKQSLSNLEAIAKDNTKTINTLVLDSARAIQRKEVTAKINIIDKRLLQVELDLEMLKTS